MKSSYGIWVCALFLVWLTACSVNPTVTPIPLLPTFTPAPPTSAAPMLVPPSSPSPLPPSSTPTQTQTPVPTQTTSPSPTPTQTTPPLEDISWSNTVNLFIIDDSPVIQWSPIQNELIYPLCGSDQSLFVRATAPDFNPVYLNDNAPCQGVVWKEGQPGFATLGGASWSPDGKSIFFLNSPQELWSMSRDGGQARLLLDLDGAISPSLEGWLDSLHLLYSTYGGSGHSNLYSYDSSTSADQFLATVPGLLETAYNGYIPISYETDPMLDGLLMVSDQLAYVYVPFPGVLGQGRYLPLPPFNAIPVTRTISLFNDWLPGTNQALVSWTSLASLENPTIQNQDLLLWDVAQNSVTMLVPNAYQGQISNDGHYLAFLSKGRAQWDSNQLLLQVDNGYHPSLIGTPDAATAHIDDYLQLVDMSSLRVMLSLRAQQIEFSPNGQYLSFITSGSVGLDPTGWPTGIVSDDGQGPNLNLLDLSRGQLALSLSGISGVPTWSPDSGKFLCLDTTGNLVLFNMATSISTPVTESLGSYQVSRIDWSYNGAYALVHFMDIFGVGSYPSAILSIP